MKNTSADQMAGILRCGRYAFGPNRLHYCGPDANAELRANIEAGATDFGLAKLLKQFKTLYPYLWHIAEANRIKNPFNWRVVEAYWLGNWLLEVVEKRKLHHFLTDNLEVKKIIGSREFKWLEEKIAQGAVPHHSFHVFNIWRRTGNAEVAQTLQSLDECRVSAGTVVTIKGPEITVLTEPLIYVQSKLALGQPIIKILIRQLEAEYDIEQIKPGQIVSIHWSVPCEVITKKQAATLKKYTLKSIALANQTI
ncbi:MAG: DUF6390 family protein [Patescibacteria group bacterium]